jgi:all-trans-nonaprenyl-diphosphate synthase
MLVAGESQRALAQQQHRPSRATCSLYPGARHVPRIRQSNSSSSSSAPWTARVVVPVRSEAPAALPRLERPSPSQLLEEIVSPVAADMDTMNQNLRSIVGDRHPMLLAAADQIFGAGGKKLRPMIVLLMARATAEKAGMR